MIEHLFRKEVAAPRKIAYETLRDRQNEINNSLPSVVSSRFIENCTMGECARSIVVEIRGQTGIPMIVAPFIKPHHLIWNSRQVWNEEDWTCDYSTEAVYFRDNVDVRGRWYFEEGKKNRTLIRIESVIRIDARGIPGLPASLAQPVSMLVERILHTITSPNLDRTMKRLETMVKAAGG